LTLRRPLLFGVFATLLAVGFLIQSCFGQAKPKPEGMPEGFTKIFNGRDLSGWHKATDSHHGDTDWVVEKGAFVGRQNRSGNGGFLLTDKFYKNFELYLETRSTYGCDGGVMLRSTQNGKGYQVLNDHRPTGNIGGIYLEGLGGKAAPSELYEKQPEKIWNRDGWNSLRIRIVGQPPNIKVWMNGFKVSDWTGNEVITRDEGMIGIQVHGGTQIWTVPDGFHSYRNMGIKELP
jgi:hypothetical protein